MRGPTIPAAGPGRFWAYGLIGLLAYVRGGLARRLAVLTDRRALQRGSAALFIAIFAPAMIFMAGLVIDGGAALEARQRAADTAEQAARAGGNECDEALLRSVSECRIVSRARAQAAAARYIGPGIDNWTLELIDPAPGGAFYGVRVTVTITFQTTLIGIVPAFRTMTVNASADAVAVTGL